MMEKLSSLWVRFMPTLVSPATSMRSGPTKTDRRKDARMVSTRVRARGCLLYTSSRLAMKGAPAKTIQELAGHQNLGTTLRYMHLSPAARESAIELLDGVPWFRRRDSNSMRRCKSNPKRGATLARIASYSQEIVDSLAGPSRSVSFLRLEQSRGNLTATRISDRPVAPLPRLSGRPTSGRWR